MAKKILLIDDLTPALGSLAVHLRRAGYHHANIPCDDDTLAQFEAYAPDLVLINLAATEVDPLGLVQQIRARPEGAIIPIILAGTGAPPVASTADALLHAGDYYFPLPLEPAAVLEKVRAFVGTAAPSAASGASAGPQAKAKTAGTSATKPAATPAAKPTAKPGTRPAVQPGSKPAVQPGSKPAVQPGSKPAVQPGSKPAIQPGSKPAATGTGRVKSADHHLQALLDSTQFMATVAREVAAPPASPALPISPRLPLAASAAVGPAADGPAPGDLAPGDLAPGGPGPDAAAADSQTQDAPALEQTLFGDLAATTPEAEVSDRSGGAPAALVPDNAAADASAPSDLADRLEPEPPSPAPASPAPTLSPSARLDVGEAAAPGRRPATPAQVSPDRRLAELIAAPLDDEQTVVELERPAPRPVPARPPGWRPEAAPWEDERTPAEAAPPAASSPALPITGKLPALEDQPPHDDLPIKGRLPTPVAAGDSAAGAHATPAPVVEELAREAARPAAPPSPDQTGSPPRAAPTRAAPGQTDRDAPSDAPAPPAVREPPPASAGANAGGAGSWDKQQAERLAAAAALLGTSPRPRQPEPMDEDITLPRGLEGQAERRAASGARPRPRPRPALVEEEEPAAAAPAQRPGQAARPAVLDEDLEDEQAERDQEEPEPRAAASSREPRAGSASDSREEPAPAASRRSGRKLTAPPEPDEESYEEEAEPDDEETEAQAQAEARRSSQARRGRPALAERDPEDEGAPRARPAGRQGQRGSATQAGQRAAAGRERQGRPRPQAMDDEPSPAKASRPRAAPLRRTDPSAPQGSLLELDVAAVLARYWRERIWGRLDLAQGKRSKALYLEEGQPVELFSSQTVDRLEDFLLRAGKITRAQYNECRGKQLVSARAAATFMASAGYLKPDEVFWAVRERLMEALYGALEWTEGEYTYLDDAVDDDERVVLDRPLPAILLEGIRRKYRQERMVKLVGSHASILRLTDEAEELLPQLELLAEERKLALLLDGTRSIEDLVFSCGLKSERAYHVLWALVALGGAAVLVRGVDGLAADGSGPTDEIDRERIAEKLGQLKAENYFIILGVSRAATDYEVERAYKKLRRDFAPESFAPGLAQELADALAEIARQLDEAYDVLRDSELREAYGRFHGE